jgi:hypothetical protein
VAVPFDTKIHPEHWRCRAPGDDACNRYTDENGLGWHPVSPLYRWTDPDCYRRRERGQVIELGAGGKPVQKDRSGRVL